MPRRTFYEGTTFQPYTLVAIVGGVLLSLGFLAFLVNLIGTPGLTNVLSLFVPERWLEKRQAAPAQAWLHEHRKSWARWRGHPAQIPGW